MELYGSLSNISGSVSASYFTGSYIGDGAGLYNLPASGVTGLNLSQIASGNSTASVSPDGFNVNTSTSITGSLSVSGTVTSLTTPFVSGSSQINITGTTGYSTFSSSIATTDLNQSNRLDSIEGVTGSYATTGSNTFKGTQNVSGSIIPTIDNAFDLGSPTYQWRDVYISSGSLYIDGTKVLSSTTQELTITTDNGQSIKILEGTTDSIVLQVADGDIELKSSGDGDILLDPTNGKIMLKGAVEILNGQKIQSSVGGTPVVFANDIVVSGSIDITGTIEGINLTDLSSSLSSRIGSLESGNTSLNSFTSSASGRLDSLETESGSVRTTVNSYTSSTDGRLSSIETVTGSILTTNTNQTNRLDSIEGKTGSYATTGSNNFNGNQTITGSLTITQNLSVLGSSSIIYSTASQLVVEDNVIVVNASYPAERFAGLEIHDSGSNGSITASLFWDGLNNRFIYRNTSDAHYGGAMFIGGPRNTGSLGDEPSLTSGRIPKSIGGDHIGDSIINEISGSIGISGSLSITGSILSTVTPIVSGSAQISFNGITDKPSLVSGSSQISFTSISDKPALVSGSAQISFSTITDKPSLVSGSSQITFGSISSIPSGLVSGSSQIDLTATTNYSTGIKTRLNAEGVISGSAQITLTSGQVTSGLGYTPYNSTNPSGYITGISFANVSSKPTTLSGYGITDALPLAGGTMTGTITITSTDIRSNATSNWTGDPGAQGKIQYHSNRWYIVSDSSSDRIVQFRRNGTDTSWIANDGTFNGSITGNAATAGGFTPSQSSGTANRIVVADGNGYIINNYFNASGGGSERNASGMGYFAGHNTSDYYYRSYTAAAAAALLSGQAMNISGNATTASSTATLSSNAVTNGYLVIGGNYSTNAYNGIAGGTRLMFGGGDADAQGNYYIGTNMEDYGGNYNKLDLRWHTGIRMGAQASYGGIRFYNNEDLGSVLFSIGASDGNVRSHTNLLPSANNSYNLGNSSLRWANLYTNDLHLSNEGKEGGNEIDGTTGDWTIQEGNENLYIINNKNGKKFKINLTEII